MSHQLTLSPPMILRLKPSLLLSHQAWLHLLNATPHSSHPPPLSLTSMLPHSYTQNTSLQTLPFHGRRSVKVLYCIKSHDLSPDQAILRQWESEQQNGNGPLPRSYWANSNPFIDHHLTSEMMRPRIRGCLKHVSCV